MLDINLLNDIISSIDQLQKAKGRVITSLEDFRVLLNEKAYFNENPTTLFKKNNKEGCYLENEITKQVILLGRFSKQLIKKGLTDFPELANEGFTYLYRLMDEESLTKMQLVEKNAHEKQTGIEIIKRLIKNGLIEEFPDKHDKRTKRVKISKLGRQIFNNSIDDVNRVSRVLSAKLDIDKKKMLLSTLIELNEFHFTVYSEYKNANIHEINNLL